MSQVTITETFKDSNGNYIDPTSVVLSNIAATFGVKDNALTLPSGLITAANTAMIKTSTGIYTYTFDEVDGSNGNIYTYWVKWVYSGHTDYDERLVAGETDNDITPTRSMTKYVTWIKKEFEPVGLIIANTDDTVIEQKVENAIRYWNTHSAYKVSSVYDYPPGTTRVQISEEFKSVVDVIPSKNTGFIWSSHPLWTLTGITVLDNVTTDLIMMSEAFRNYRIYVGTNFRWTFDRADEPTIGGYLYLKNVPMGANSVFVMGTKRITKNEDIKSQYILDWILYYAKALVKQSEGNALRKAGIIDTPLDGQQLYNEGREEQKELQKSLQIDSRWIIFMKRK